MKKSILSVFVAAVMLLPVAAFAAGGGAVTATPPATASSASTVTVTIPKVIGIDVESDLAFDFTPANYTTGTVCVANFWPPKFCGSPSSTTYDATTVTTTGGAATDTSAIWMAIFSTDATGSTKVNAKVGSWNAGSPGFPTTALQSSKASATNNPMALGNASLAAFSTTDALIGTATTAAFPWTRADQVVKLVVDNASTFNAGTYTTNITYTITK